MWTHSKDDGMIEVMEEEIEIQTQVILLLWSRLWEVFVVFRVERRRDPPEHPTNCETWKESEVRRPGDASHVSLLKLVMSEHG